MRVASSSGMWCLARGLARTRRTQGVAAAATRSNWWNWKVNEELGRKLGFNEIVNIRLAFPSIGSNLCIYRQYGVALLHGNRKTSLKQTNSSFLIGLDLPRKYRNIWFTILDHLIFVTLSFLALIPPIFCSWCGLPPPCFKCIWSSIFLRVFHSLDLHPETIITGTSESQNWNIQFFQTCQIWSSTDTRSKLCSIFFKVQEPDAEAATRQAWLMRSVRCGMSYFWDPIGESIGTPLWGELAKFRE
jgi:hypothetical protein